MMLAVFCSHTIRIYPNSVMYKPEHCVIQLLNTKEHVVGDVTVVRKTQKFQKARLLVRVL